MKLGVLGSTRGSNLEPILAAIKSGRLDDELAVIVSNKADAGILARARQHQIVSYFIDPHGLNRESYDRKVDAVLSRHGVECVLMIGYMRIV